MMVYWRLVKTLILFISLERKSSKNNNTRRYTLGLFMMTKQTNGKWTKPKPFAFNSSEYSITHPHLSDNGKTLAFSDMKNDLGEWTYIRVNLKMEVGQHSEFRWPN